MGVGGGPSGCPDVQLLRTSRIENMWEERRTVRRRRGDWWEKSEERQLPRVGSLHYLCGHCGHAGHSLLVREGGLKPRSEHNLFQPLTTSHNLLDRREKLSRPKSVHSFEQINTGVVPPNARRRKKRRRRTVLGAPTGSPPEHDYESLVSKPGSNSSQMQTLDVRIKVTRAVMRESGEFDAGSDGASSEDRGENGCSVYDNITVRDGQDNDSWQYTTRIPQDCLLETSWKRSSAQIVSDTGQEQKQKQEKEEEEEVEELSNENRKPRLKMFKLKCLNKVASFSIFK